MSDERIWVPVIPTDRMIVLGSYGITGVCDRRDVKAEKMARDVYLMMVGAALMEAIEITRELE